MCGVSNPSPSSPGRPWGLCDVVCRIMCVRGVLVPASHQGLQLMGGNHSDPSWHVCNFSKELFVT